MQPLELGPGISLTSTNTYEASLTEAVQSTVGGEFRLGTEQLGLTASVSFTMSTSETKTHRWAAAGARASAQGRSVGALQGGLVGLS